MVNLTRSQLRRYSVAVITVVIALLLTRLIWWLIKPTLYPLFLAAVIVSSWYGGIGPGLLATALAALASVYFFTPPIYSLAVNRAEFIWLFQFVLVALLINYLNAMVRSTQRRAELNALEAQRNYERLRQSQESLRQSEERYRLLVEGVTDYAIFMLDTSGHIISWNIGAERILGYQEAEVIGQPFSRIFTPEAIQSGRPEQVLRQAVAEGFSRENRWHVRKDGSHLWSHCVVTALRDGSLHGFAKIMQDITQRKQAEEEREQLLRREQAARAEAEAANRSKDEFLAILSHELRTPMTAIIGWTGMLNAGKLDETRAALALETIERNANSQLQLIEDLLDISRIIQGNLSLNFGLVEPIQVITAAIETVQLAADTKTIQIKSILDPSATPVWGDSDRLQQVVCNLLSNAIKFTPEGGRVEVRLERGRGGFEARPYVQIKVSDTGKGISADFLPYVFERFRQADSTSQRSYKGLGLGLAIARHLVELHGGTIQAESQGEGQGATFTLNLPIHEGSSGEAGEAGAAQGELTHHPSPLAGLRILVVDDEAEILELLSTILQEDGAEVIAVDSVDEALELLEDLKPDVLVSDIAMPGKDGYVLIRKVKELEVELGTRIPAIALTAYARVEERRQALLAGFQIHLTKPVKPIELIAAVASLAESSEQF
ncbi:ATP-binding protein [Chroococcidiopsis sp. CCMEE 29]|uniref:ATP-binding response regulator n=1 Tax=Chroococcidiopsis sp. CCMEE 29 TaxID=155894 RepID=UPI002020C6CD|nr:ATP-binding protein [Chroococcidiopsis sp. CCMEE 29]